MAILANIKCFTDRVSIESLFEQSMKLGSPLLFDEWIQNYLKSEKTNPPVDLERPAKGKKRTLKPPNFTEQICVFFVDLM